MNPTADQLVQGFGLMVTGRVIEIRPAEWTTPDKKRPANPWQTTPDTFAIITPVIIAVDSPALVDRVGADVAPNHPDPGHRQIVVAVFGGRVGNDVVESNDPLYQISLGQRVLVALSKYPYRKNSPAGKTPYLTLAGPAWRLGYRYLLTDAGEAISFNPSEPKKATEELITAIKQANAVRSGS